MKPLRAISAWFLASIVLWLGLSALIGAVSVEGALHPPRLALTPEEESSAQAVALRDRAKLADVAIVSSDGLTLRSWSIRPADGNGDTVILFHGQADNRAGMLGAAEMLLRHGFAVLLPDARAHGESGGAIATYGALETEDIRRWVDWAERTGEPHCVFGLGDSMGAAELLESLPSIPDFCAAIAESPFAEFRLAAYDRIGQWFHKGPWLGRTILRPPVEFGFLYAHARYHVNFAHVSPEDAVRSTRVPVLLIHGLADTNLPPRHSEEIKAANPRVELWEPVNAGHCGASSAEPEEYERRVITWFQSHDRQLTTAHPP
jgi:uncharacterized protein